jgi:hypothetical protein
LAEGKTRPEAADPEGLLSGNVMNRYPCTMSMPEGTSNDVHWLPRIALGLGALGLALIVIGFLHMYGAGVWFRSGAVAWLLAYFLVLFDNYKRRIPVQTRGGVVRREDGAVRYAMPFAPMVVMGAIALLVVLTA